MSVALSQNYPTRLSVLIVLFCVAVPLYGIAGFLGHFRFGKWPLLLGELLLPLPAYLYLHFKRYNIRRVFRLNAVSGRLIGLSAGLATALHLVIYEIDRVLNTLWVELWRFLPPEFAAISPTRFQVELEKMLSATNGLDWIVIILASVLAAGIFEEMLFRGFVQSAFEPYHRIMTAITISAAIFAANHAAPWLFLQVFLFGFCLGWLAWRSNSIIPGAVAHGLNNLFAVFFVNFKLTPSWLFWESAGPRLGGGHIHPFFLIVAIAAIYFGCRLFNRICEEETEIPTFLNTPV
jgi:membrane protease YdiL (CAAX protease family)